MLTVSALLCPMERGFRVLTGNDVGILLADELLAYGAYNHPLVATTIVSTSMLEIADHYGLWNPDWLKWIAERSIVHQADGGILLSGLKKRSATRLATLFGTKMWYLRSYWPISRPLSEQRHLASGAIGECLLPPWSAPDEAGQLEAPRRIRAG